MVLRGLLAVDQVRVEHIELVSLVNGKKKKNTKGKGQGRVTAIKARIEVRGCLLCHPGCESGKEKGDPLSLFNLSSFNLTNRWYWGLLTFREVRVQFNMLNV